MAAIMVVEDERVVARDIQESLEQLDADAELTAGVITANGSNFCAGMDLKEFATKGPPASMGPIYTTPIERPVDEYGPFYVPTSVLLAGSPGGVVPLDATHLLLVVDPPDSGPLKGVLDYTDEPLVSIDLNGAPASSTVDSLETAVIDGKLVRVVSWYDNEWGFSNRMVDTAGAIAKLI